MSSDVLVCAMRDTEQNASQCSPYTRKINCFVEICKRNAANDFFLFHLLRCLDSGFIAVAKLYQMHLHYIFSVIFHSLSSFTIVVRWLHHRTKQKIGRKPIHAFSHIHTQLLFVVVMIVYTHPQSGVNCRFGRFFFIFSEREKTHSLGKLQVCIYANIYPLSTHNKLPLYIRYCCCTIF